MASGIIGFILGLLIGAGIMAATTAAARDDVSRAEDKDSELKMLKKNNRALTDYCNAYKYLWRHKNKNGLEDLKKARWYLDRYITMQTEDDKAIRSEIKRICEDELRRVKELLENRECYIRDLEHELGYDKCIEEVLGDA